MPLKKGCINDNYSSDKILEKRYTKMQKMHNNI